MFVGGNEGGNQPQSHPKAAPVWRRHLRPTSQHLSRRGTGTVKRGNAPLCCLSICLSLHVEQAGRTSFLMGGRGGGGDRVYAEMGGRLLALELFGDGHKPG